jgi:hypothetical protein
VPFEVTETNSRKSRAEEKTMSVKSTARIYRTGVVVGMLMAMIALLTGTAFGQGPGTVGVLVEFPGQYIRAFCVEVETPTTNVPPLLATGLDVATYDYGFGDAVCAIEGLGCPATAADCFCECTFLPGERCLLWNYFVWNPAANAWDYPVDLTVQGGDVIAWVWGELDTATFTPIGTPSLEYVTLDRVCEMERGTVLLLGSGLAGLAGYAGLKLTVLRKKFH